MKHLIRMLLALLTLSTVLTACGDNSTNSPTAPTNLVATGSLGNIHLSWVASTGTNLTGYNVYRSTDGVTFAKLNTTLVTGTSYDDVIASPAGDGVLYYYKVTATGNAESAYSNVVKSIHGTRLNAAYPAGFTTTAALSPFVAEGNVVVEGGDLTVDTNTKLYVLDNSTIDIEQGHAFTVNGLLRVLAATTAPAAFTSHVAGGGALTGDQGFNLAFINAVDFASGGNSGTLVQNTRITNLRSAAYSIYIFGCTPKLYNLYITASANSAAYLQIDSGASVILQNCSLTNLYPSIFGDQTSTGFQMDHNIITTNIFDYLLEFVNSTTPPITDGQIANNTFDGPGQIDLGAMTGGGTIPLGNNYWPQGLPTTRLQNGADQTLDLNPVLTSAPTGVGPTW
ncbi:MAG: hypothetical protein WCA04_08780 [Geobacteraceae bacterium]